MYLSVALPWYLYRTAMLVVVLCALCCCNFWGALILAMWHLCLGTEKDKQKENTLKRVKEVGVAHINKKSLVCGHKQ